MTLLTDIGGTYARFAVAGKNGPENIHRIKAEDFENFSAALQAYCALHDITPSGSLRIATAGYEDKDGLWKFVNKNKWQISPVTLEKEGWSIECILNDFEAATWALLDLQADDINLLKPGTAGPDKCLLGPGTGLGLGFLHEKPGPYVQKTHGGHIPAVALTDEQALILQTVARLKGDDTVVVFENVASGPGLYNIYAALCLIAGKPCRIETPEEMLENPNDLHAAKAITLFHEFLGLFAASVVVTGHAYGGLYLTGGVLAHLVEHNLFNFDHFEHWFCLDAVDSVKQALQNTPVFHVVYPYPALKGLMHA